jgi:hypothetical protein
MNKPRITKSERLILSRLVHQENIETLKSETGLQFGEIRDDLTNLLSGRMIDVFEDTEKGRVPTTFYDLDNLGDYYFRATKRGQTVLNTPTEPEWNSK